MITLLKKTSILISLWTILISCTQEEGKRVLFTNIPSSHSHIDFQNKVEEDDEINILTYEYTYNGGGVAAADFNNDGLCDLFFTGNEVGNKLYLNRGALSFEDATQAAGVEGRKMWKTGVSVADVNADGWLDIYVCYSGFDKPGALSNQLFINQGSAKGGLPTFKEQAKEYGIDAAATFSTQASFFDYDRDGDLDMFLISHGNHFYAPFFNTKSLRNTRHPQFGNRLYRNDMQPDSSRHFVDVSENAGIHGGGLNFSLGVSVADLNNDSWPDIYVTNDYEEQDFMYINNMDGTFTETSKTSLGHMSRNGMGCDIADYNNDGKPDIITLDMLPEDNFRQKLLKGPDDNTRYFLMVDSGFHHQQMRNTLQLNQGVNGGTPIFSEIGQMAKVSNTDWSWAPLLVDVDNDGYKDLFITNGYLRDFTSLDFLKFIVPKAKKEAQEQGKQLKVYDLVKQMTSTKTSDYLFKNNADLTFSDKSLEWGISKPNLSFGATYADLDNDGDLELITNNTNEPVTIWENHSNEISQNHFLRIKLKGPKSNPHGIGAKVVAEDEAKNSQTQELILTRGFQSSVEPIVHFGLGKNQSVKRLVVYWHDGRQTVLQDVKGDQTITVLYEEGRFVKLYQPEIQKLFTDVSKESGVNFTHRESTFIDFNTESLIPNEFSKLGPPLARGDVNQDGSDDFYIGGAAGQSGQLFISDGKGKFYAVQDQPWAADAQMEDTGAVFFDVDGDQDLDLFVVSGGNEFPKESPNFQDRLYVNYGKGLFRKAPEGSIIKEQASGTCVAASDFDRDGDVDQYVGGGVLPGSFPLSSPGAILLNETNRETHQIKFKVATSEVNPALRDIGIVTDAAWADINNDQWPDLIVVGEWMPIRIFQNDHGKLIEVKNESLAGTSGLWKRILTDDFDGDGDLDLVIGNNGLNLPWTASVSQPLELYYADFNKDGRIDPIMCSYVQGKSYPVATRDELFSQLSNLRKKFTDYKSYAQATLSDVFSEQELKEAKKLEVQMLQSVYLENSGNGNFKINQLPMEAQFSVASGLLSGDFNSDGKKDILLSGNFFPWRTQYGPTDAGYGLLLAGDGKGKFSSIKDSGFYTPGDVRGLLSLKVKNGGKFILVGKNNSQPQVLKLN